MAEKTSIGWCHHTFNPWWGCTKVSPGCANCYAEKIGWRRNLTWAKGAKRMLTGANNWKEPFSWDKVAAREGVRKRVFCASMADVFDPEVPNEWRTRLFKIVVQTPHLDWLILTKRPEHFKAWETFGLASNVWLGVSVEDQKRADERIPILRSLPAFKVKFLSVEPMLEAIDLTQYLGCLNWVICGGESGTGFRPMQVAWAQSLFKQCRFAYVPFYMKQDSGPRDGMQGRIPPDLWKVKEFPFES